MKRHRKIKSIPIAAITMPNPRDRQEAPFKELVASVAALGLKRPITVSGHKGSETYELVCGQGRIEAFAALKAKEIPAVLVEATAEDCILMSLVENIARRRHSPVELVGDIGRLARHSDPQEVAAKLGVSEAYVNTVCYLLRHGEDRLIKALERKTVLPTLALEIARARTPQLQAALLELHTRDGHTTHEVAKIRKLFGESRRRANRVTEQEVTPAGLVRAYRRETDRQKLVARKAALANMRLLFIESALRTLLNERMFITLLREEGLDRVPLPLLRRLSAARAGTA
jgi:ParB family chromosome partitioning protein